MPGVFSKKKSWCFISAPGMVVITVVSDLEASVSVPVIVPDIEDLPPSPSSLEQEKSDNPIIVNIKTFFIIVNFIMFDCSKTLKEFKSSKINNQIVLNPFKNL